MPQNFLSCDRDQPMLLSPDLRDWLPEDHLACLWDCGLVERERRGAEIHYRLVPGLRDVLSDADTVLATAGERVRACPRYGRRAMRRAA